MGEALGCSLPGYGSLGRDSTTFSQDGMSSKDAMDAKVELDCRKERQRCYHARGSVPFLDAEAAAAFDF